MNTKIILLLLFINNCGGTPSNLAEKTYVLSSNNKSTYTIDFQTKNGDQFEAKSPLNQTIGSGTLIEEGKNIHGGSDGSFLLVTSDFCVWSDSQGNISAGFEKTAAQTTTNLNGIYNYVSAVQTASELNEDYGTIEVVGTDFQVQSIAFTQNYNGIISKESNGTYRALVDYGAGPITYANFIFGEIQNQTLLVASVIADKDDDGTDLLGGIILAARQTKLNPGEYDGNYELLGALSKEPEAVTVKNTQVISDNGTENITYNSPEDGAVIGNNYVNGQITFGGIPLKNGLFFGISTELGPFVALRY